MIPSQGLIKPKENDPRSAELVQAHSVLAKTILEQENAKVQKVLEMHPELETPEMKQVAAQQMVYSVVLELAGFLVTSVRIDFYTGHLDQYISSFWGSGGGLAGGAGTTWGTAWLNYGVDWLASQQWNARFEANALPAAINVNLWGLGGEYIGSVVGGGLSAAAGVVGGQGYFFINHG